MHISQHVGPPPSPGVAGTWVTSGYRGVGPYKKPGLDFTQHENSNQRTRIGNLLLKHRGNGLGDLPIHGIHKQGWEKRRLAKRVTWKARSTPVVVPHGCTPPGPN